jgi:hypothetical protein
LRNPVDRAYSHYQHQVQRVKGEARETLTFEEAIEAEERILPREVSKMLQDEYYESLSHRTRSYLRRGILHRSTPSMVELFPEETDAHSEE